MAHDPAMQGRRAASAWVLCRLACACPILGAKRERSPARTYGQMRLDAFSVTTRNVLTSVYSAHQVCSNVCAVRDNETAGSNPATPTNSEGM